ncbi:MAG TPA: nitroreductase [Actinomycetota bacterium]|nr:nitroreductase [Actinomycetota bacterium]
MDVIEAMLARRSVPNLTGPAPDRSVVEEILRAAVRVPNHFLTEPWRFIVLTGKGLDELGEALAERVRRETPEGEHLDHKIELERARPHRAPMIIVLVFHQSTNPKAIELEDRYSMGALGVAIMLAAKSKGLGTYWRTGPASEDEGVKNSLGLEAGEEIAGFMYIGHVPQEQEGVELSNRTDPAELTTWRPGD